MLVPLMVDANRQTGLATLVADVVDQQGAAVYRSHPNHPLRVLHERELPLLFFAPGIMPARDPCKGCVPEWTLRVGYGEGTPTSIALANTTGYRTLLGRSSSSWRSASSWPRAWRSRRCSSPRRNRTSSPTCRTISRPRSR